MPTAEQQVEPLVENPIVIGHEEDQPLNNTGMPAFGWVTGLRRKGRKLFADIVNVFPAIAKLIRAKAYKHVSPEIYDPDKLPEGVPAKGHMLRRLALLGGQLPHIKSLADLPEPFPDGKGEKLTDVEIFEAGEWQGTDYKLSDLDDMVRNFEQFSQPVRQFTELTCFKAPRVRLTARRRLWQDSSRTWLCFSEVTAMADDAVQQVANAAIMQQFPGLPEEFVQSLTPDQMGMLATAIAPAATEGSGAAGMVEWPADAPSKEAVIAALVAQGEDQADLMTMSDEELVALYQQKMGGAAPMSDDPEEFEEVPTVAGAAVSTPTRRQPTKVTTTQQFAEQLAELNRGLTAAQRQLAAQQREQRQTERLRRQEAAQLKRSRIASFCEEMVQAGYLTSAEVDVDKDGNAVGPVLSRLLRADAMLGVKKFGEKIMTELDLQMEEIRALGKKRPRRFGEQVADPLKQTSNFSERVEQHYEARLKRLNGRAASN